MEKKGVSGISGKLEPIAGELATYSVSAWYPGTPQDERNPANVTWELFKKRSNGRFTTTNIRKRGISSFTFGEGAIGDTFLLEGYLYASERKGIIIIPQRAKIPQIKKVELFYVDDTPGSEFSFTEKLRARANCINMLGKEVTFTLWEDDVNNEGHAPGNLVVETKKARINREGIAVAEFTLTRALMQKAMQGETDIRQLE